MRLQSLLILFSYLFTEAVAESSIGKRAIQSAPTVNKHFGDFVEGSGSPSKGFSSGGHSDLEVHGSGAGYSPDDEDGDSDVHGSGAPVAEIVEGSGLPSSVMGRPQVTTTTTTTQSTPWQLRTTTKATHAVLHPIEKLPDLTEGREDDHSMSVVVQEKEETTTTSTSRPPLPTSPGDSETDTQSPFHHMLKPGIFAAVVGGTVVGLLTAVLLVMFIIHRMRKKDEGSYALDEPKPRPYAGYAYTKASTKEFYA